eukprot:TRINITY_DN14183_c0_g2_i1.p2 TRINITY_DN14183_c0_g2~~TRINITY_DN14183_c0_g2_i1.p2  ORF type:complete len:258 (-),score=36.41 TRINITY_DN14183_c0_g2_i1:691-1464(-)
MRRLISLLQFSADEVHWIGHVAMFSLAEEGANIEPAGSCLSKVAMRRIGQTLQRLLRFHRDGIDISSPEFRLSFDAFPRNMRLGCEPFELGDQMRYTTVLNACFRAAGVYPTDPRNVHDLRGRTYFPNVPLDRGLVNFRPRPPPAHCSWLRVLPNWNVSEELLAGNWMFRGKEYLYLPCQCASSSLGVKGALRCNARWVADFPVAFHGHICSDCRGYARKDGVARLSEVHGLVRGGHRCDSCGSVRPRVDWRFGARN